MKRFYVSTVHGLNAQIRDSHTGKDLPTDLRLESDQFRELARIMDEAAELGRSCGCKKCKPVVLP